MLVSQIKEENLTFDVIDRLLFQDLADSGESADCIIVLGSTNAAKYRVPVAANAYHAGCSGTILLCGGAAKETVAEIAQAMKAQLPNLEVISGGTVGSDPAVVRGLAECDAVILVEQLDQSDINAAMQLKARAKELGLCRKVQK